MEFQLSSFKSWKTMLWKCCTQYASTFGKFSSGHRTGKGQFSFQSQRKAMPKNAQTTAQLHSSHTLVKYCSKFFKPGFSNTWTMNSLMFKLVLEKAEEPEIKLPTSVGSLKKQESSRKTSTSALLTMPMPLTGSQWNGKFFEMRVLDQFTCLLRNLYAGQEAAVRTEHGTTDFPKLGKDYVKAVYCHPTYFTYMQSTLCKMPDWMKHKLESRLPGEILVTSDMQMTPRLR